jgi:hypothetical protein
MRCSGISCRTLPWVMPSRDFRVVIALGGPLPHLISPARMHAPSALKYPEIDSTAQLLGQSRLSRHVSPNTDHIRVPRIIHPISHTRTYRKRTADTETSGNTCQPGISICLLSAFYPLSVCSLYSSFFKSL